MNEYASSYLGPLKKTLGPFFGLTGYGYFLNRFSLSKMERRYSLKCVELLTLIKNTFLTTHFILFNLLFTTYPRNSFNFLSIMAKISSTALVLFPSPLLLFMCTKSCAESQKKLSFFLSGHYLMKMQMVKT